MYIYIFIYINIYIYTVKTKGFRNGLWMVFCNETVSNKV